MTATATSAAIAPVPATCDAGRVLIGHDTITGEPVDYVARTDRRACNGLITGGAKVGKTTLAEHIVTTLEGTSRWTRRWVRAQDHDPQAALEVLAEAEQRMNNRDPLARLHLVIWDGFERLSRDRFLCEHDFADRVVALAEHGPEYGVAQLVIAESLLLEVYASDVRLRDLLADNLLALRTLSHYGQAVVAGHTIDPASLPRERGHALALLGDSRLGRDLVHVHLDGTRTASGCDTSGCEICWRAAKAQLAQSGPPTLAWDPQSGFAARLDEQGNWRWVHYIDGSALSDQQIADLRAYQAVNR